MILDLLVVAPAVFGLVLWLQPSRHAGVLGALLTLLLAVLDMTVRRETDVVWIDGLGVHWHLLLDGVSAPFVLLTALVVLCCQLTLRDSPRFAALLLFVESGVLGTFLAADMVLFFVFFEVALIPMWFAISTWGDERDPEGRRRAANRFLVFTMLGSAVMLVGFLVARADIGTLDITRARAASSLAAFLVGLGLAVKVPLWPLHIWLPGAHSKAPTEGSVVLAALLLKLGTFGLIRFWLPLVPERSALLPVLGALGVVGIVYGALACLTQTDLKCLIAYSSIGHMGFVALAVSTDTALGVQAAVYASVAHGVVTGLLFLLAGAVKERFGTGELAGLAPLYARAPRLGALIAFAAMASLGLPGLAGFWGEVLTLEAALSPHAGLPRHLYVAFAVVAAIGVVLTAAYFLRLIRVMLQGDVVSTDLDTRDHVVHSTRGVRRTEVLAWTPLVVLTVVLGVAPGLLLGAVGGAL